MTATMMSESETTYVPANDALHSRIYIEFICGFNPAPGVDLGPLGRYGRTPTASGVVFRQDYADGVAIANLCAARSGFLVRSQLPDPARRSTRSRTVA